MCPLCFDCNEAAGDTRRKRPGAPAPGYGGWVGLGQL